MLSVGGLQLLEAEALAESADLICAMTIDGLRGTPRAFDPRIHQIRPFPGQVQSAAKSQPLSGRQRDPAIAYHLPPRSGRLLVALRAPGARSRSRRSLHRAARFRNRVELRHRQPARDRRRDLLRRQLSRRAARASVGRHGGRSHRTRRCLGAPNRPVGESVAQRRAPAVSRQSRRPRIRIHDGASHRRRAGGRKSRARSSRVHRLHHHQRQQGGLRQHGHDLGA